MAKKVLILPKSDGTQVSVDESEWRRRDQERRHGPLFKELKDELGEDQGQAVHERGGGVRYYGAMASHGGHHD